jgi:hypothetical protein
MDGTGTGAGNNNGGVPLPGEFNITDFMMDANRDWLFQQGESKFIS